MARISLDELNAWLEQSKLAVSDLTEVEDLLAHLEEEVITRLETTYDTSGWTSDSTTPKIVRTIISKYVASWIIDKEYSENQDEGNDYAKRLCDNADSVMERIIDGTIVIPEVPNPETGRYPSFYPNDASSAQEPTSDDPSLGGPYFSLGMRF